VVVVVRGRGGGRTKHFWVCVMGEEGGKGDRLVACGCWHVDGKERGWWVSG
jgi:hypothetical protein